ncbi:hypothetical protein MTO96_020543 [Rhipicephalus appendiculatus]
MSRACRHFAVAGRYFSVATWSVRVGVEYNGAKRAERRDVLALQRETLAGCSTFSGAATIRLLLVRQESSGPSEVALRRGHICNGTFYGSRFGGAAWGGVGKTALALGRSGSLTAGGREQRSVAKKK